MNGHWICEQNFDSFEWFGFVYQITNITNNRKYIGKKYFSSKRRKKVTGRKNRRVIIKESDWQSYTSSSDELNEDINKLGKENFEFRIIKLCKTKRDLGYSEVEEQFKRNVLEAKFENGEREYYNRNIMSRWFRCDGHNEETRKKISEVQKGILKGPQTPEHSNNISKARMGMKFTKRHKENISKNRFIPNTPEINKKRNKTISSLIWINNGSKSTRIKPENFFKFQDWQKGRKG